MSFKKTRRFTVLFLGAVCLTAMISFAGCGGSGATQSEISVNSIDGATDVAVDSAFRYTFLKAVNTSTVTTTSYFIVPAAQAAGSTVKASYDYDTTVCDSVGALAATVSCPSPLQCDLVLAADLENDTSYTICLTAGDPFGGIHYFSGDLFEGFSATFQTSTAPSISAVLPLADATNVAVNTAVQAVFSKDMDSSSIDTTTFHLASGDTSIEGAVSYSAGAKTATWTPSSNLASFQTYTAQIDSTVKDDAGNKLGSDYTWSFTTSDIIAPTVTAVDPADGATGVARGTTVTATFSEDMDESTITTDQFQISSGFGSVPGSVAYSAASKTAQFTPASQLYGGTTYTIALSNSIKDTHGNALNQVYSSSFRTEHAPTTEISTGLYFTAALKTDGTVWTWGGNSYGQSGDGTDFDKNSPVQVSGLTDVTAISSRGYHVIALKTDGTVWTWGRNNYGQLGDGTTTDSKTPVQISGLTGVTAVAAGGYGGFALKGNGSLWAWGYNIFGQLGDGTTTQRTTPVQVVSGLTDVSAFGGGSYHGVALKDGNVWTWGNNSYYGELGDGTNTNSLTPVQVCKTYAGSCTESLTGISAIAVGAIHTIALKTDGTVWAWGHNGYGNLGDGSTTNRNTAVQVSGLTGVTAVAPAAYGGFAFKNDGSLWAWGYNTSGQLGDGTTINRTSPVRITSITGVDGIMGGFEHTVAKKAGGSEVWAWGNNYYGQIGDGSATYYGYTPHQVTGLTDVTAVAGGWYTTAQLHTVALKGDGTVWAWGQNPVGEVGDGTTTQRPAPVQVCKTYAGSCTEYLTGITAVTAGMQHNIAIKGNDGTVWTWGLNGYGQLGDGSTTNRTTAVQVSGLTGITAVAGGGRYHTVALKGADGTVWAWGRGNAGQLGDGTATQSTTPVQVSGLTGMIAVAAGATHSLALKADGTVWAWGDGSYGDLGDGTTTQRNTPVQVHGPGGDGVLNNVIMIAGGFASSTALKDDGHVWRWGYNFNGQLGDGTTTQRTTPVQSVGLTGVTAIGGSEMHVIALKGDGTVWTWGSNQSACLGDGSSAGRTLPVQVVNLNGVTAIDSSVGRTLTHAIKSDGTLWQWGWNDFIPLGDGTYPYNYIPSLVDWSE